MSFLWIFSDFYAEKVLPNMTDFIYFRPPKNIVSSYVVIFIL